MCNKMSPFGILRFVLRVPAQIGQRSCFALGAPTDCLANEGEVFCHRGGLVVGASVPEMHLVKGKT
jgi:hypothetical protein